MLVGVAQGSKIIPVQFSLYVKDIPTPSHNASGLSIRYGVLLYKKLIHPTMDCAYTVYFTETITENLVK